MPSQLAAFPTSAEQSRRRPLLGYSLVIGAYALMLVEMALLVVDVAFATLGQRLVFWAVLAVLLVVYFGLLRVYRAGRRLLVYSAQEAIARDPRPYVLYLRAFKADVLTGRVPEHGDPDAFRWWRVSLGTVFKFLSPRLLFAPPLTEEEQVVRAFRDIGPVIAVGAPHEMRRTLGAPRVYIAGSDWRTGVSGLVRDAAAVVIHISDEYEPAYQSALAMGSGPGLTEGLQWEVATLPGAVLPSRLFLLIAASDDCYAQLWTAVASAFPRGLPPTCESRYRFGRVRGLIGFENDWQSRLFPFSAAHTSPFRLARYPVTSAIREALGALRERRHARSPWPSLSAGLLGTAMFMLVFLVLSGSIGFTLREASESWRQVPPPRWAFLGISQNRKTRFFINTGVRSGRTAGTVVALVREQGTAAGESDEADIPKAAELTVVRSFTCSPSQEGYGRSSHLRIYRGFVFPQSLPVDSKLPDAVASAQNQDVPPGTAIASARKAACYLVARH